MIEIRAWAAAFGRHLRTASSGDPTDPPVPEPRGDAGRTVQPDRPYAALRNWYGDLHELVQRAPWSPVMLSGGGAVRRLAEMETAGRSYRKFLSAFPGVLCEPLDSFYVMRRQTAALDLAVLDDMINVLRGWREAQHAAWLALLAPRPAYLGCFVDAKSRYTHAQPVFSLAIAACGGTSSPDLKEAERMGECVRRLLAALPPTTERLRHHLSEAQERQYQSEIEAIRSAYRRGDTATASTLRQSGMTGYFAMSHREWCTRGRPDAPAVASGAPTREVALGS